MSHTKPLLDSRIATVRTVGELRGCLTRDRQAGLMIGLVPTMGALHEGHLSLIRRARDQCDRVVVSLFINPSQFNEHSDLEGYPRSEQRDAALAAQAGADVLFAPSVDEVYPPGFSTAVEVLGLTDRLEGAVRGAAHFRGVCTVVTKLLCMAMPDIAYFGQKDAQQVLIIRRLVVDLNLTVRIEVCPTVREGDGLAMSSRNALLTETDRSRALGLHAALNAACREVGAGEQVVSSLLSTARAVMGAFELEPEYLTIVDPDTLEPLQLLHGPALLAVAARVGKTRLIDNVVLQPATAATAYQPTSHQPSGEALIECNV